MRLSELTGEANEEMTAVSLAESVEVTRLTADSRKVGPGYLFAALPGARGDGRDFIDEAVADGVPIEVVFVEPGIAGPESTAGLLDADRAPTPTSSAFLD